MKPPPPSIGVAQRRLLAALLFSVLVTATTRLAPFPTAAGWTLAGLAVALLAAVLLCRVNFLQWSRRLLFLEPFALGAATLAFWQPHGGVIFACAVTRATLCLGALVLLGQTTPFAALLAALRAWHFPGLLCTTLMLLERYRSVLVEESARMRRARAARVFLARRTAHWQALGELLGQLFVRTLARTERLYAAMCARGWRDGV